MFWRNFPSFRFFCVYRSFHLICVPFWWTCCLYDPLLKPCIEFYLHQIPFSAWLCLLIGSPIQQCSGAWISCYLKCAKESRGSYVSLIMLLPQVTFLCCKGSGVQSYRGSEEPLLLLQVTFSGHVGEVQNCVWLIVYNCEERTCIWSKLQSRSIKFEISVKIIPNVSRYNSIEVRSAYNQPDFSQGTFVLFSPPFSPSLSQAMFFTLLAFFVLHLVVATLVRQTHSIQFSSIEILCAHYFQNLYYEVFHPFISLVLKP